MIDVLIRWYVSLYLRISGFINKANDDDEDDDSDFMADWSDSMSWAHMECPDTQPTSPGFLDRFPIDNRNQG